MEIQPMKIGDVVVGRRYAKGDGLYGNEPPIEVEALAIVTEAEKTHGYYGSGSRNVRKVRVRNVETQKEFVVPAKALLGEHASVLAIWTEIHDALARGERLVDDFTDSLEGLGFVEENRAWNYARAARFSHATRTPVEGEPLQTTIKIQLDLPEALAEKLLERLQYALAVERSDPMVFAVDGPTD